MRYLIFLSCILMVLDIACAQILMYHGVYCTLAGCLATLWSSASLPTKWVSVGTMLSIAPLYGYPVLSELFFLCGVAMVIFLVRRIVHSTFLVRLVGITVLLIAYAAGRGFAWTWISICGTLMVLVSCLKYTAQDRWATAYPSKLP